MAQSSVMVSLPQMVDLALHSPEPGAVNFNILHSLLHVIIQQMELIDCKVEFRGNDSERIQNVIAKSKPGPTLNLTEYVVTPGKDQRKVVSKKARLKKAKDAPKSSKEEVVVERELRIIEQRKNSKEEPARNPTPMTTELSSTSMQTVILVEPTQEGDSAPHVSVALSRVHFDNMEDEIEKLKDEVRELKELPANMGLIDALRNAEVDKSSPVLDMFQILTLVKRVEASETGITKLASMLEDLAREQATSAAIIASAGGTGAFSGGRLSETVVKKASDLQVQMQQGSRTALPSKLNERLETLEKRVILLEEGAGPAAMKELVEKVSSMGGLTGEGAGGEGSPAARITGLESKFTEYAEHMANMDTMFTQQVQVLQTQFTDLEKEIGEIVERMNAGLPAGDMGVDHEGVRELYNKFMAMQEEMEKVTTTAAKLMEDKEERQMHMDALLEQVELLKTIKADREDLEDALADKADTCAVNRKVSHDQFESACDDLSHSIEDALSKLTNQEQLWQQALDDIQNEIGNKLDKMELTPLKDFVTNKLKMLQDRLKALASLKQETEAAGTKSKFLRNVNCISCDKDVVMRKQHDVTTMPPPPALPPTKSMAPYLAYELDNLRKQQKCAPHSRNMNHFESAMTGSSKIGMHDDHICNRYCGGSHTVTTPQQRVTRLGHFLQQWGPDTQAAPEGQLRGTDGQWYKTRDGGGDRKPAERHSEEVEDEMASYMGSMKTRPSMVVQGDILSARFGKSSGERSSSAQPPPSVQGSQRRTSTASKQGAVGGTPRSSIDAGRRSLRSSAEHKRESLQKALPKQGDSHISFKEHPSAASEPEAEAHAPTPAEEAEAAPAPAEEAEAPPAEEEAPPAAEGEAEAAPAAEEEPPPE